MSPKRAKKRKAAKREAKQAARRKGAAKKVARAAPKRSAKKKRVGRKGAPRTSGAKKSARKAAKQSARGAAKKPARRAAGRPPKRPVLKVVARPAAQPAKPARTAKSTAAAKKPASPRHKPFGGAIAGASAKDLALFDLVRARVEVQGAIQGMVAASAETPVAEGKWNPRQIVLHLHYWDREMLPHIEPAYLHNRRPPQTRDDILAENASSQQDLAGHDWEVAKRLMQQAREAVLEALQSLPEEPAEMWSAEHALGWLIRILSHHDRHHAAVIKDARTRTGSRG